MVRIETMIVTLNELRTLIKQIIKEERNSKRDFEVVEVKYFSPSGIKSIPNGHPIQKGGFIKECVDNSKKFKVDNFQYLIKANFEITEAIHPIQYGLSDYRGGIVIFSTDVNSLEISKNKLFNWFLKKGKTIINRFLSKSKLNKIITKFNLKGDKKLVGDDIDD